MSSSLPKLPKPQQYVGLLERKASVRAPGHMSKQNTKKISSAFSYQQIYEKTLRSNKIVMKSFSKKLSFGVDCKL